MAISVNESTFLGFAFELILWGFYAKLFLESFSLLTWKRRTPHVQSFYLFFCCFLFCCCTIHLYINFFYMYTDLVVERNSTGTIQAGTPALRTADALVTLTDFFGEIVLIYRLWTIWNKSFAVIVLPTLMSFAFVSCAMSTIAILVSTPSAAIVPKSLVPLGTAAFALPLCFNFIVTGLIIWRIWVLGRKSHAALHLAGAAIMPRSFTRDGVAVIVESGMLYLVVQFVFTVLFAINHPAQILLSDVATQIYGIAPTLIFVRVGAAKTNSTANAFSSLSDRAQVRWTLSNNGNARGNRSAISASDWSGTVPQRTDKQMVDNTYELNTIRIV